MSKTNAHSGFIPTNVRLLGAGALVLGILSPMLPAIAGQLSNGQTFFDHPPSLIRSAALQKAAYAPSTYEFTLTVPANAGQALKAVRIVQAENVDTVHFNLSQSKAFDGKRVAAGSEIPLASVGGEQPVNPGDVTIVFDQPVQPGSTVAVALDVKANPAAGGVYEFGVTAFPAGEKGEGMFLGYRRINFISNSD